MDTKSKSIWAVIVSAVLIIAAPAAQAWVETFETDPADLSWNWYSVRDVPQMGYPASPTFEARRDQAADGNHYIRLYEPVAITDGASFGIGFVQEDFSDVRVGAVVNVTDEAMINYQGFGARATYVLTPTGGIVANTYIMHVDWEDGPANLSIDIEKVVQLQNIMERDFNAVVPGFAHQKSYYAELEVVGSDPTFVTGSLYAYKGGPLVARTPTLVDTSANDDWEESGAIDAPFPAGQSGVFAQNENPDPVGFDVTFDDISSTNTPSAAALAPADGAVGLALAPTLRWVTAAAADSVNLYLGPAGAMSKVLSATTATEYTADTLQMGQTYNWRVDQNTSTGVIQGMTWSFTTIDSVVVDDFESYTPDNLRLAWDPNIPGTLSTDPNGLNYLETETVQQGAKAMRIEYRNQVAPAMRQYTRTFASPMDWTTDNVKAVTLAFRGANDNAMQLFYLVLTDNNGNYASVPIGDSCSLQAGNWYDAHLDLAAFAAENIDLTAVRALTIGIGDGTLSDQPAGDLDTVYIDNIRLYQPRCFNTTGLNLTADVNADCAVDLNDFAVMAASWLNNGLSTVP
jgi:hypothetical protein